MKFLHCSDVHLGRRPLGGRGNYSDKRFNDYFAAFDRAIDIAIENNVDAMIIAGDFFDKKELHPEVLLRAETALARLKEREIHTVLIEGNHDNIYRDKYHESWIIYLENKGLIQRPFCRYENESFEFTPVQIDGINFFGLGYPGAAAPEMINELAAHLDSNFSGTPNVVLVHTGIGNGEFIHGAIKKEEIDILKDKAIYVAGGHLHEFNAYPPDNPYFFLPGSLEHFDLGDRDKKMGMIIFDTASRDYQFIETVTRRKLYHTFTTKAALLKEFEEEFKNEVSKLDITPDEDIVEIAIKLENDIYIDIKFCEDELEKLGALKSKISIYRNGQTAGKADTGNLNTSEIEKHYISKWDVLGAHADIITGSLQKLKQHQAENNESSFFETFDNMIDRILQKEAENEDK